MIKILKHIFLLVIICHCALLYGQQTIPVSIGDHLSLQADSFRGNIQWQISSDGNIWDDISEGTTSPFDTEITSFPSFYRAKIDEEGCDVSQYSEVIEVVNNENVQLWSDPTTWPNNTKPEAGGDVIIPSDQYIILDEDPPNLGGITIEGVLEFDRADLNLTSEWIVVNGTLRIGTENEPFTQKAIITLNATDTEEDVMGMGTRGIMVMTGSLELHGATPDVIWTKINEHADAGATSLSLIESVNWNPEDEIVVAPTDYYQAGNGASVTQRITLSGVSEEQLTLSEGLNAHRWGLLQYPTSAGMSLTDDGSVTPPVADTDTEATPLVLDERAEVGNMTRNIVIQSPDDDLWAQGFGAHTMIMPNATAHVEGVEFKRAGQSARLRRYAFHWHMLSYSGSETLSDAAGQYFRKNTINSSANRGVVIHGTNGVLVQDNIIFDVRGHGVFTEDAVERRNTIDGNLVLHIRNPEWGNQLMMHEAGDKGSSGMWIANPDNIVINNTVADCQTFGYWLAYPEQPFGLGTEVLAEDGIVIRPNRLLFGVFDNNTAHSNRSDGLHLDDPQIDEEGNTAQVGIQYWSTTDGRTDGPPYDALSRFTLSRLQTWKNMDNGSWDRGVWTDMNEFVSADNCGRFFAGSGANGIITRGLIVGTSLNFLMNGTGRPATADFQFHPSSAPTAFATYHSAFSMTNNILVNFEVTEYDRAGVFASDDYYLRAVDKGMIRNTNNLFIQSHPGVKLKSGNQYYTLASALWDPHGFWGPEGNYFVYDDPFLTYGKTINTVELGTDIAGGVSVEGPFYGFAAFVLHGVGSNPPQSWPDFDLMAIHVDRYDPNDMSTPVGTWDVTSAQPGWTLQHMRDFATSPESIYELTFPDEADHPTDFLCEVENMMEEVDTQVIGIQYDGSINPYVRFQQEKNANNYHFYAEVGSLQAVIDSDGETWWQDKPNNMVWVKIRGGRWEENEYDTGFEATINETMQLLIRPNE